MTPPHPHLGDAQGDARGDAQAPSAGAPGGRAAGAAALGGSAAPADLVSATATELLAGYAAGTFTPSDVCEAVLARIDALEPALNAFYLREPDAARAAAATRNTHLAAGTPTEAITRVPLPLQ